MIFLNERESASISLSIKKAVKKEIKVTITKEGIFFAVFIRNLLKAAIIREIQSLKALFMLSEKIRVSGKAVKSTENLLPIELSSPKKSENELSVDE